MAELLHDWVFRADGIAKRDGTIIAPPGAIDVTPDSVPERLGFPDADKRARFGARGARAELPDLGLSPTAPFTIELHCRLAESTSPQYLLAGNRIPIALYTKDAELVASVKARRWTTARSTFRPGRWAVVAVVFTGEDLFLLVDAAVVGRRVLAAPVSRTTAHGHLAIGGRLDGSSRFQGDIAGIRIWSDVGGLRADQGESYAPILERIRSEGEFELWSHHANLGGDTSWIGPITGRETRELGGRQQRCQAGSLLWSRHTGAAAIPSTVARLPAFLSRHGFPHGDPEPIIDGWRRIRSEKSHIFYRDADTPVAVHGEILATYLYHDGPNGNLGLPAGNARADNGGFIQAFTGGHIYQGEQQNGYALGGAINNYYQKTRGWRGPLGWPISGVQPITRMNNDQERRYGYRVRFESGSVWWTKSTGAVELRGMIDTRARVMQHDDEWTDLGLPTQSQYTVPGTDIEVARFEHGVIVWRPGMASQVITKLQLHLGEVTTGKIDDDTWFIVDRTAEAYAFTTVTVDGKQLVDRRRSPKSGHSGSTVDLDLDLVIAPTDSTVIDLRIEVHDEDSNNDDFLGEFSVQLSVADLWGTANDTQGHHRISAQRRGPDTRDPIWLEFSVTTSEVDPTRHFRQEQFWQFDNFSTAVLSRERYAETFRDVEHVVGWWEKALRWFDTLFYDFVYEESASSGNCFGLSLEAVRSLAGDSPFQQPLSQWAGTTGNTATATASNILPHVQRVINRRHGYQLSGEAIRWYLRYLSQGRDANGVADDVDRWLRRSDYPILCLVDVGSGSGHCVVPYRVQARPRRRADRQIFVADPNLVWREAGGTGDPSSVVVRHDGTFVFQNDAVSFDSKTSRTTVAVPIPYHVLSGGIPRTPYWEVVQGVVGLLTGIFVVSGDADAAQVNVNGIDLYRDGPQPTATSPLFPVSRIPIAADDWTDLIDTTILVNAARRALASVDGPVLHAATGIHVRTAEVAVTGRGTGAGTALVGAHHVAGSCQTSFSTRSAETVALAAGQRGAGQIAYHADGSRRAALQLHCAPDSRSSEPRTIEVDTLVSAANPAGISTDALGAVNLHGGLAGQAIRVELTAGTARTPFRHGFTVEAVSSDETLHLDATAFDPTVGTPTVERLLRGSGQFVGTIGVR